MLRHSVVSKFTRNINHCYFNFLFELLSLKMSLIWSYLLSSFSFVTIEDVLIKKVYSVINKIYKHLD